MATRWYRWCEYEPCVIAVTRWRHQMEIFSVLLAICEGNSPVTSEFPSQRPVTQSFDVFFDLRLNKRLSKQSIRWSFETSPCSSWRHCNVYEPCDTPVIVESALMWTDDCWWSGAYLVPRHRQPTWRRSPIADINRSQCHIHGIWRTSDILVSILLGGIYEINYTYVYKQ